MGKNKKENFIFTLICCALMVLGMTVYNVILRNGFNSFFLRDSLLGFLPIFCIALLVDWIFISKIAKILVSKLTNNDTQIIKKVLLMSFFMVCGMCFCMTLITLVIHQGISTEILTTFVKALFRNFIFALPLQLVIVGPISRTIFFKLYPVT